MSILPQALQHPLNRLQRFFSEHFLPGSCLLCAAASRAELLCPDCLADLPLHQAPHCPQCALPTAQGQLCGRCLSKPPHFDQTFALFRYEFPVDRIIQALKYGHQLAVAQWLGQALAPHLSETAADCLMPMPLHVERLRQRGFNQSVEIARMISRARPIALDTHSLLRRRPTPPQAERTRRERLSNVSGAFECRADLSNNHILLLDDVMTSGASVNECARILKLHGAAQVTVIVAARALWAYD